MQTECPAGGNLSGRHIGKNDATELFLSIDEGDELYCDNVNLNSTAINISETSLMAVARESLSYTAVRNSPDWPQWRRSTQKEIDALDSNKTSELVPMEADQ